MTRKAAAILGGLSAAYAAVVAAYFFFEDPFLTRDKTLQKFLDKTNRLV